ncbi:hypothetical protein SAMN06265337_0485 [Hymenobacter gelipurpurascens]|uniref:Uncharacterized protein n=1 Tax=Hymenobacter gelipurpurascens TaxID=89968 RepID=A0A212T6L9_9BACT|nr:hypothetical protein SAMN06265337_0485 [Hymenobacter gelipurpurascens]
MGTPTDPMLTSPPLSVAVPKAVECTAHFWNLHNVFLQAQPNPHEVGAPVSLTEAPLVWPYCSESIAFPNDRTLLITAEVLTCTSLLAALGNRASRGQQEQGDPHSRSAKSYGGALQAADVPAGSGQLTPRTMLGHSTWPSEYFKLRLDQQPTAVLTPYLRYLAS